MNRYFLNPVARSSSTYSGLFEPDEYRHLQNAFQTQPTPLWRLRGLASALGLADILLKDESGRMGLNAFKILGVSYAVSRLLSDGRITAGSILVCATEGNHGRAVARAARENGCRAKVYMSCAAATSRIKAIEQEGAEVIKVAGNYDEAVRIAADHATKNGWTVVSDTAWPGYEEIPHLIMAGYTRLMEEAENQWAPAPPPDVVLVQAGVGGLTCAVASWLCHQYGAQRPFTIACEPASAACLLESVRAGRPVAIRCPFNTIMAGLRSGEVSHIAWPAIAAAVDGFVAIDDDICEQAMRVLARPVGGDPTIIAGASGASGLAVLLAIFQDENLRPIRETARLGRDSRVMVINTEGATDPELQARIVEGGDDT